MQDPILRSEEASVYPAPLCWCLHSPTQQNWLQPLMYWIPAQQVGLFPGAWLASHSGSAEKDICIS